jgi:transposase
VSEVTTIGLDIAKSVFHAHGADERGTMLFSRKLTRGKLLEFFARQPRCLVALEACGGAHHWARQLQEMGYTVRLIPPAYVKPFVKRHKNDAIDAEAICEAAQRPGMRFVAVKTEAQQAAGMVFRTRDLLVRQRTQLSNAIRGHLSEFGLIAPKGRNGLQVLKEILEARDERVPAAALTCLQMLYGQLELINEQILVSDRAILASARSTEVGRRLMEIPGVGPLLASALVATISDPAAFKSGRNLAAWIGLVPRQNSSGGKERLGSIPLDPANLENGVMQYVRGSHLWGQTYAPNVFVSQTPFASSPEVRCPDIEGRASEFDITSFDVEPGDVIIHDVRTVHGAGGNPSDLWRRAVSFRYCGDRVRYFDRPGSIPQVGVSHQLRDGDRLLARDYPIVWPKPWPGLRLSELFGSSPGI